MAKPKEFGVISIVAHPHPEGAYRRLFGSLQRKSAKFYGDQYAALSPISKSKDGIFLGRLAIWTQVDDASDVINLESFEEISFTESDVIIPRETGLLSKVLQFSFNEKNHRLYVELMNEQGKTMSAGRVGLALSKIIEKHATGFEEVYAVVVPDKQSVSDALKLPGLRLVEIQINRPNPDEFDDEVADIIEELTEQDARSESIKLVKTPSADALKLNERNTKLAKVGSVTGYLRTVGRDATGKEMKYSTKEHPMIIPKEIDDDSSTTAMLRNIASDES